jgi:transposase
MMYVGIDLHRLTVVVAVEDEGGQVREIRTFQTRDVEIIRTFFSALGSFKAVIEASCSYRWLFDLVSKFGEVVLAHPFRLRAIVSGRAKTDKLDARLLAKLLRAGLIPPAYVPPLSYQVLRDLTRGRARLSRDITRTKNEIGAILAKSNIHPPYASPFGVRGLKWLETVLLPEGDTVLRDGFLRRLKYLQGELEVLDGMLERKAAEFPEHEALTALHGVGRYTALLVIAELGDPFRFSDGRKVGAYAGLSARVSQSGQSTRHGNISRQGSAWLRWILVEAAIKVIRRDIPLQNFYTRIRKRSGVKVARVAVARKLAGICWERLIRWHNQRSKVA